MASSTKSPEKTRDSYGPEDEADPAHRELYDRAVNLVNQGIATQNTNESQSNAIFAEAIGIMKQALDRYGHSQTAEAVKINKKMRRYIKMIGRRDGVPAGDDKRGKGAPQTDGSIYNIIDMDDVPEEAVPVKNAIENDSTRGDIIDNLSGQFGFQPDNCRNCREHVLLLLTNYYCRTFTNDGKSTEKVSLDKAAADLHSRLFNNYKSWCKYIRAKPAFSENTIVDICLFFLIWGESANFRACPEYLCYLFHKLSSKGTAGGKAAAESGEKNLFLMKTIKPMYEWLDKENKKTTVKGQRAEHTEIRNYDDVNEFFWSKKCLKYDETAIAEAFSAATKSGAPKTVKKSFVERRSWWRMIWSFRRIWRFNCALFLFLIGISFTLTVICPRASYFYHFRDEDGITLLGRKMWNTTSTKTTTASTTSRLLQEIELVGARSLDEISLGAAAGSNCSLSLLTSCLGIEKTGSDEPATYFANPPKDFGELQTVVSFSNCMKRNSKPGCSCYIDTISQCFLPDAVQVREVQTSGPGQFPVYTPKTYQQSTCVPQWKAAVNRVIYESGDGCLNCKACGPLSQIDISALITSLIKAATDFNNLNIPLLAGVGVFGWVLLLELLNLLMRGVGATGGYVGRNMPTPFSHKIKYVCFWILLIIFKAVVSYTVIIDPLVNASIFIWFFPNRLALPSYHFMFYYNFHNIAYILALWIPSWIVFMYDFQIWFSLFELIAGAVRGFNMRIGAIRSFPLLRASFRHLPEQFLLKCVGNFSGDEKKMKKMLKAKKHQIQQELKAQGKKKKGEDDKVQRTTQEKIDLEGGTAPMMGKAVRYTSLFGNMEPGSQQPDELESGVTAPSNEFQRMAPFALAWNRILDIMREEDVINYREHAVLRYLVDAPGSGSRQVYPPAFLVAGKLDEAIKLVQECAEIHKTISEQKNSTKKQKQIDKGLKKRLFKDQSRMYAIEASYRASAAAFKTLIGRNHQEISKAFEYIDQQVASDNTLDGLNLLELPRTRVALTELMRAVLNISLLADEAVNQSEKFKKLCIGIAEKAENVLASIKKIIGKNKDLVQLLDANHMQQTSFFFPKASSDALQYCMAQVTSCITTRAATDLVGRAFYLLTVENLDAEPKSPEGRRRLRFFTNSLFMDMPSAKAIRQMHSISVSTPYYAETCLYSSKELSEFNDDHVNTLFYLQTVYPDEWANFMERMGDAKDGPSALSKHELETRLWASYRGQTLARTVRGMTYIGEAIRFLYWLEIGDDQELHHASCNCNLCIRLDNMVSIKFSYVVTCQIYGKQKEKGQQQASDIDFLLMKHPLLRVAYVDEVPGNSCFPTRFFSVLIKGTPDRSVTEIYRVELPGNPIVGEGKPENTNHAIIFTRGEYFQAIDMNQDGYFEEWLKMPNLLRTTDGRKLNNLITIIGYREYVFTGAVSALAEFMSIQELAFVSLGQRMLAMFLVRMHYGHPDIFDKIFAMGNGGTAKNSKLINLSEDIFAGFNTTLRGGQVTHEEFIQCGKGRDVGMQQLSLFEAKLASGAGEVVISRDIARMANSLDFCRLHSFFYGNIGWYITQTMTAVAIYAFIYCRLYIAFSGLEPVLLQYGTLGIAGAMNVEWAFQFGFLLAVPIISVIGVESGFRHGLLYLFWNTLSLGPVYFTFQMGTKMHYFDRTLLFGGAKYRATGRGFTIKHESFAELFRFYAFSHMYRGVELLFLLIIAAIYFTTSWCGCLWTVDSTYFGNVEPTQAAWRKRCYEAWYQQCVLPTNQNYGLMTFALWIIAAAWIWAPLFFNPYGLDWEKLVVDYKEFDAWLERENETSTSWIGWWLSETEFYQHATKTAKAATILRKCRFLFIAWCLWYDVAWNIVESQNWQLIDASSQWDSTKIKMRFPYGYAFLVALVVFAGLLTYLGYLASRIAKKMTMRQKGLRKLKFFGFFVVFVFIAAALFFIPVWGLINIAVCIFLIAYFILQVLLVLGKTQHIVTRELARTFDRLTSWFILAPFTIIVMFFEMVSHFQKRIMFNTEFSESFDAARTIGRRNVKRELMANDALIKKPAAATVRYQLKRNKKDL